MKLLCSNTLVIRTCVYSTWLHAHELGCGLYISYVATQYVYSVSIIIFKILYYQN